MRQAPQNSNITLAEAEKHYQSSRHNYTIESAESHLVYYREKYAAYYQVLLNN